MPSPSQPKNWPPHIPYLTTPTYSKTLTPTDLLALKTRPSNTTPSNTLPKNTPKGPSPLVKITPITTPSHPANGQSGLFATKTLPAGTFILQYLGVVHKSAPIDHSGKGNDGEGDVVDEHAISDYDLSLDRFLGISIDAAVSGNEARFVNDYRGVKERPNAEFRDVWDESRGMRGIGVFVLGAIGGSGGGGKGNGSLKEGKGVRKGEEILVSYGRGFWGARKDGGSDGQ